MNALVPVSSTPPMTVTDVERIANAIAKGGLFGSRDPNAVLTLCLLAQAEGQHPAVVFRDYHVINGKPAKKAEAMLRDFINAGGKVEWHQLDDTCADATFTHPSGQARISWDHERAKTAGLGSNQMYRKFPRQMLRSRVISEGIRTVYPGATSGLYEEGEVASFDAPKEAFSGDSNEPLPAHDTSTGEIIEASCYDPEAIREPEAREKLVGDYTSKTGLRKAIHEIIPLVRAADTLQKIEDLKIAYKRTINQALRDWPALVNGDPRVPEDLGLKGEFEKRIQELSGSETFSMCMETLNACASIKELEAWFKLNSRYVDELSAEEIDRITVRYDELEAGFKAAELVRAG